MFSSATLLIHPPSQRHEAVLLARAQLPLREQILERLRDEFARVRRLDHIVHQPVPRRNIGVREGFPISFRLSLCVCGLVFRLLNFISKDDFGRTFRTHDRNFRSRPCVRPVRADVLRAHCDITPPYAFRG